MHGSPFAGANADGDAGAGAPGPRTAVVVSRDGGLLTISLRGDLDRIPAEHIIGAYIGAGRGAHRITVDLAGATVMTCTGLRTLLKVADALAERGTTIAFVGAAGDVRRIVDVAGLADLLGPAA
jgi:anti-anti-sigma factor